MPVRPAWHFLAAAFRLRGRSVLSESFFDQLERRPWAGRTQIRFRRFPKRRNASAPKEATR